MTDARQDPIATEGSGGWSGPQKGIVFERGWGAGLDRLVGEACPGDAFVLPLMTLAEEALEHNIQTMARWCSSVGAHLAPHAKTTMSPEIVRRQLEAGAWGLTAATISQVMALRSIGAERILLANELVDPAGITWLASELRADPGFNFFCYADSSTGIELLEQSLAAAATPRPVPVLIELGHQGGRTGCRNPDDAANLAALVAAQPNLQLAGVAGYEGSVGHDGSADTIEAVRRYVTEVVALARRVRSHVPTDQRLIVSAGGSAFFDVVAEQCQAAELGDALILLRSGAYVTHDDGFYRTITPAVRGVAAAPEFVPALSVWAHVLSRPEPDLLIAGAGRRDVPFDEGLPAVRSVRSADGRQLPSAGFVLDRLNDQHAFVRIPPDSKVAPGDMLRLGISHPCTAFDKWRVIPVIRDGVVVELAHTLF